MFATIAASAAGMATPFGSACAVARWSAGTGRMEGIRRMTGIRGIEGIKAKSVFTAGEVV
jgi:hypothetical protein